MPSDRVQRRIDKLLDQAEEAADARDWPVVHESVEMVLALDADNADALAFQAMVEKAGQASDDGAESEPPAAATVPLPSAFVSGRYQVQALLGEGARKVVYRAHDTRLDRDVAFALIKTAGLDADGRARIQREAQAMARLSTTPEIVTVFDTGEEDGQPFIVAEYMAGGDLTETLQDAPDHRLPLEQVRTLARQLCRALAAAHAQGVVHRDVKPGNVWLTADGAARLGDFGLALAAHESRLTSEGSMVGTVAYMAPEQAAGGTVDARSDLYALGCVLYECVTGRPPFLGDDAVGVITQHLNTAPVAPAWHRDDCPPDLEALILHLLAKAPDARPASAVDVEATLAGLTLAPVTSGDPTSTTTPAPVYRRTFVGREQELGELKAAFDAASGGQGGLAMVVGEPGIGKTTLTEQLATYVTLRGGRTLVGHCYEEGSLSLPYLPFVEAMRSYVLDREPAALAAELGSGAGDVARIVSEIRDRLQVEPPAPTTPEEDRYRLFQAVAGFLAGAGAVQPLCLVLEDLQDADQGTLELLQHLSHQLAGTRLLVVGTYRDVEVDRAHPLSAALAELRRGSTFLRVPLRGLTPDEVQRMLANIAGQDAPWGLAEAVHRQTEGNPLFIQEVFRYIAEEGLLQRKDGAWTATNVDSLITQIPEGLRDVIGRRLSRLSPAADQALAVAAVIGREFELDTLRAVADVSEDELLAAIGEAEHAAVIEERRQVGGARYRFTHAFFRQTLYEELIAPRRLRLHREIAGALEQQYTGRLDEHAVELAGHFAQSSDPDDLAKAVAYGERGAHRAMSVYAYGEAARLLDDAVQVQEILDPSDAGRRCDLLLGLGDALLGAGQPLRVVEEIAPAVVESAERAARPEAASHAAVIALDGLRQARTVATVASPEWAHWAGLADRYAPDGSRDRVFADVATALARHARGEYAQAPDLGWRALSLARDLDDSEALYSAVWPMLRMLGGSGRNLAAQLDLAREFATGDRTGVSARTLTVALANTAEILFGWGERDRAERVWRELEAHGEESGEPYAAGLALYHQYGWETTDGRLEETLERAIAKDEVMRREGAIAGFTSMRALYAAHALGRFDDLPSESIVNVSVSPMFPAAVLAFRGQAADASRELHAGLSTLTGEQDPSEFPVDDWLASGLLAAVLLQDREAAKTLRDALVRQPYPRFMRVFLLAIDRVLAMAAVLLDDPASARTDFTRAIRVSEEMRHRPEVALSRLGLAEVLLEHFPADRAEGMRHLDFAIDEFRAMHMAPYLERAMRLKMEQLGIAGSDVGTSIDAVAISVGSERPDLARQAAPDGTVTLLFSDIEGSTPLNARLGDRAYFALLQEHNAIVRAQLAAHSGFEVKSEGDGFMLAFKSAVDGLRCAIGVQRALAERNESAEEPIRVRIGLHTGEAIRDQDDFFGLHVNLAARVGSTASGGEILVSALLKELAAHAGEFRFDDGREVDLKGIGPQRVHRVEWRS